MLRCMYSGISGMRVNQTKLDVTANNITNVSTTGFKSSRAQFSDMLYQNAGESTAPTSTKGGTNAKQVGLGAKLSSINKVMGQGNFIATSRSLDCAIDGDGYFMVGKGIQDYKDGGLTVADNKVTGGDIDVLYTRDGNFSLDNEGNLLTADGRRVMGYLVTVDGEETTKSKITSAKSSIGEKGNALFVNADALNSTNDSALKAGTKLQPLKIPDYVLKAAPTADGTIAEATDATTTKQPVKSFTIGTNGLITGQLGDGTTTVLGQIAMASFKNPEGLTDQGGNLANVSANSGPAIIRSGVGEPAATDNSKGYGDVAQGVLEGSNVDLTEQFTDMITATRCFQAASKMISTGDEILQTITGLMR